MGLNVIQMSNEDRLVEVLTRSKDHFGPEGKQMIDALLAPENIAIMIGTLLLWAGSHLFGVGEIIDVLLLIVGAATIGWSIGDVAKDIYAFADLTINARSEDDLNKAAKAFSHAVVLAGFTTIMALLLRRSVKQIQVTRGANVLDAMRPRSPGFAGNVGADPYKGQIWSKPQTKMVESLPPGQGKISPFGDIYLAVREGTVVQERLAYAHELVHRFLSPRLGLFRTFRAQLRMSGYLRSALLQYLEESLAETYAQFRVNGIGFTELLNGISFPIENGYITIGNLFTEGIAIGNIFIGGDLFLVRFTHSDAKNKEASAAAR